MTLLSLGLRYFLACVFIASSVPKLVAPRDFGSALRAYRAVPERFAGAIALWLPRVELAIAIAFLAGIAATVAASIACALLLVMGAAVGIDVAAGRIIDCGCFGRSASRPISWILVAQNVGLALASAVVAIHPAGFQLVQLGASASATAASETVAAATGGLAAVVAAGLLGDVRRARAAVKALRVSS